MVKITIEISEEGNTQVEYSGAGVPPVIILGVLEQIKHEILSAIDMERYAADQQQESKEEEDE